MDKETALGYAVIAIRRAHFGINQEEKVVKELIRAFEITLPEDAKRVYREGYTED
ncbi:hypothetical protein ACWGXJ_02935 [Paenibacillus sp. S33]|uniref:hypothetical protein n=1 Tax=Paenibacillus polymyxa TaxID=1406 RepID=UPI002ED501CA|nr:hypothetical protein [Paenibacillus polymyxa]